MTDKIERMIRDRLASIEKITASWPSGPMPAAEWERLVIEINLLREVMGDPDAQAKAPPDTEPVKVRKNCTPDCDCGYCWLVRGLRDI